MDISSVIVQVVLAICGVGCVVSLGLLAWSGIRAESDITERQRREIALREEREATHRLNQQLEADLEKMLRG